MMVEMPRPRPPHLQRQVTQHGKVVWYVRIGRGPRVRIRGSSVPLNSMRRIRLRYRAVHAPPKAPRMSARSPGSLPATAKPSHGRRSLRRRDGNGRTFFCT